MTPFNNLILSHGFFDTTEHPHRRYNALTGEWVLVSPHRSKRPWQGQQEEARAGQPPRLRPTCYLCPGNSRVGGEVNPKYDGTFVFNNDFGALQADVPTGGINEGGLLRAEAESGMCRVICFSPRHDLTLPEMDDARHSEGGGFVGGAVPELGARPDINYVQIFENKGAMMGAQQPAPARPDLGPAHRARRARPRKRVQQAGLLRRARPHAAERLTWNWSWRSKTRVVLENEHFVALVPFWAVWPFETLVISRRHVTRTLTQLTDDERDALADILRQLTIRYDNLFQISFPYSAGLHQRPTDGQAHPKWHLHMHFYPPLLRSATVRKFMVGYELLANPQRDVTPEFARRASAQLARSAL